MSETPVTRDSISGSSSSQGESGVRERAIEALRGTEGRLLRIIVNGESNLIEEWREQAIDAVLAALPAGPDKWEQVARELYEALKLVLYYVNLPGQFTRGGGGEALAEAAYRVAEFEGSETP